jgi:molybdenum cofactor guanylyltransferase
VTERRQPTGNVAGAVLAGGASRRMGRTKALIDVGGVPMAGRVAGALAAAGCRPVVIVGGDPDELQPLGLPFVADRHPGAGPLGGVITALEAVGGDVVVAACDLPELDAATVLALLDASEDDAAAVIVAVTDRLEPALARWPHRTLTALHALFDAGQRSLQAAVLAVGHVEVPVAAAALRNINTPGDLGGSDHESSVSR